MTRLNVAPFALCLAIALPIACTATPPTDGPVEGDGDTTDPGDGDIDLGTGGGDGDGDIVVIDEPPTMNCGDGILDDDEACDDKNMNNDDGCGSNCRYIEPGWVCPDEGQPCRRFAKCGDGVPVFPEQCDDGNLVDGDGCSDTCKVEIGSKCEGTPSVCSASVCGDSNQEGAETCDDSNGLPFDGCSERCQGEPVCAESGCTTTCGDGLIIGDEQCDDGNAVPGDGCSDTCQQEPGYECSQAPKCADGAEDCPIDLPIVFRDFSPSTNTDFQAPDPAGTTDRPCDGFNPGIAADTLGPDGKPVFASAPAKSCTSAATFSQWYVDSEASSTILGSIRLYPNGEGGYVNRYGENGEPYLTAVATPDETNMGATLAECQGQRCMNAALNGQEMFDGEGSLRCDDICRPIDEQGNQAENQLNQLNNQLMNATDPDVIAGLEADILALEEEIAQLVLDFEACQTDCQAELDARVAECAAQCAPCSNTAAGYCTGGELRELDGDPLFFPIDGHPDALTDTTYRNPARIPAQIYNGLGWPWEDTSCGLEGTCATTLLHNFHFTSEIAYWFEYQEDMVADLTFIGDDDVFVFVNRRLVIDLGGIHVPLGGQLTINGADVTSRVWQAEDPGVADAMEDLFDDATPTTADALGLVPGNVYEIKVFHAERKPEGSSFQLTLSGFNTARSECVSICGDGILAAGEECDNGAELNVGGHNGCEADCTLGAYCGDGVRQEESEQCDDADPNAPAGCSGCRVLVVR
jgi:fibro-slime domain-containing protein